jgi:hypothetical protein
MSILGSVLQEWVWLSARVMNGMGEYGFAVCCFKGQN